MVLTDKKILEVENVLKDTLTPYILLLIQDVNNYLRSNKFPFLLVVVGGDALAKFFPNDPKLDSHDYDVRLTPIIGYEDKEGLKDLQMQLSAVIAKYFEQRLNSYVLKVIPMLRQKLRGQFNDFLRGIKLKNGDVFEAGKTVLINNKFTNVPVDTPVEGKRTGDLYTVQYTLKLRDKLLTDSLIDIFAARPDSVDQYYDNITDNVNEPKTFIPYVMIEGVPYASLGFLIWDTLRLIEKGRRLGYEKLPRYQMKLEQLIRGLYHPNGRLSCLAMKEFVKGCVNEQQRDCVVKGKTLDKRDLVDYAVSQGFIPSQLSDKFKSEFSKSYLCEYINDLQSETDKLMSS